MAETTPIYTELVVKYYLSKGIKPFSYPHEPVEAITIPKVKLTVGDMRKHLGPDGTVGQYIDLLSNGKKVATVDVEKVQTYNYFRL